jgi:hypothetical protein
MLIVSGFSKKSKAPATCLLETVKILKHTRALELMVDSTRSHAAALE